MTTDKQVNIAALQAEALAIVDGTHVELTLIGVAPDKTGIAPVGGTLLCSDGQGSSATAEPCATLMQAYKAHVAAPTVVPDPLKAYREALSTAATNDPGLASATKTALDNLLTAMAPRA